MEPNYIRRQIEDLTLAVPACALDGHADFLFPSGLRFLLRGVVVSRDPVTPPGVPLSSWMQPDVNDADGAGQGLVFKADVAVTAAVPYSRRDLANYCTASATGKISVYPRPDVAGDDYTVRLILETTDMG